MNIRTKKETEMIKYNMFKLNLKNIKRVLIIYLLSIAVLGFFSPVFSSTDQKTEDTFKTTFPKVFIDCEGYDLAYIQNEVKFVTHVQSENQATVIIRITSRKTEDGRMEYTLTFLGRNGFEGDNDSIKYQADSSEWEDTKSGLVDTIKMGLMRYVGKSPVAERISVTFMDKVKPTSVEDKWDFWVFSVNANTFLNGEKLYTGGSYYGSFSANRVTPELKVRLSVGGSYNKSIFTFDDYEIESTSSSKNFTGLIVKSINDHWSIGAYLSTVSSTYSNIDLRVNPAPAVEFNVFPYSESTKKQLRLQYRLNFVNVNYTEETIYEKTHENLWNESLSTIFEMKQKWGTASASIEGSHYFHDFSKYRIHLNGDISLRLVKGLKLNFDVNYSRIHDQLALVRGGASFEEILLRQKELATNYDYFISFGLSYSFGSTQSNIVNPRFGGSGGSISISF